MFSLEVLHTERPSVAPRAVMFDFDGTVSLIRRGWHDLLFGWSMDLLRETPRGKETPEEELAGLIRKNIEINIGKQTVFQCRSLAESIERYGGRSQTPQEYDRQYAGLLEDLTRPRLEALRGGCDPHGFAVSGTYEILYMFRRRNVKRYLVSGTEENLVREDARLLRVTEYFDGGIYGGRGDPRAFSKEKIVKRILDENDLRGKELIGFGDGRTETVDVKAVGGFAVGVASDETTRGRIDPWKREQLVRAGADWIIPDYGDCRQLELKIFGDD